MARKLRVEYEGAIYHLTVRSNGGRAVQQRDCRWRPVVARMLCRYGGLTQRAAAKILGMRTGVGVSCQLRRLVELTATNQALDKILGKIERQLDREQQREDC